MNLLEAADPARHPVVSILMTLLVGVAAPFFLCAEAVPTDLLAGVARERLVRFQPGTFGAMGEVISPRPAIWWRPVEGAARYQFRLYKVGMQGETPWTGLEAVSEPHFLLKPPSALDSGCDYRWTAMPVDEAGAPAGSEQEGRFRVSAPSEEFTRLSAAAGTRLDTANEALVLAGFHAERKAQADLAGALFAYLGAAPEGEHAALCRRVLQSLGIR